MSFVHTSSNEGAQIFLIRENTCNILGVENNHRQAIWLAAIMKNQISRHPGTTPIEIRIDILRDSGWI